MKKKIKKKFFVHKLSDVKSKYIGSKTKIWQFCVILGKAKIGKNCNIFPGAVISAVPQDLKFGGEDSLAIIGDNTTIRECVTINRGTVAAGKTVIGKNCLIMATAHIAHDCMIGDNAIIVNGVALAGHVTVGQFAVIGGLAAVHQFISIGDHAMVSGGSLVRKDVPPFSKAAKEPLSYVGINSVGLRRRGFTTEKIKEIQDIYRILYQKNYNTSQALSIIEAEMEATPERDEILDFIRNSSRGIMKGYTGSV
jgi:UDP-N-acetylglucosamine acyltransferase